MNLDEHELGLIGSAEGQIMNVADRIDRMSETRLALHVRMSRLKDYNRQAHHLRIASHTWEPMIQGGGGTLYRLSNDDLLFIGPRDRHADMDAVLQKTRKLFGGDPLIIRDDTPQNEFAQWYDLQKNYSEFRSFAERMQTAAAQRREQEIRRLQESRKTGQTIGVKRVPLDPNRLSSLVQAVYNMDLGPLVLSQPVCAVTRNDPAPKAIFSEYFIAIGELANRLIPGVNLAADKWLFQYLTSYLDKRVLALLPESQEMKNPDKAVSINVNVATLLSDGFLDFDAKFRTITKKPIVLELQPHDIFGDMNAFAFARDFCRERGYKICLDGLNHLTFPLLNRAFLKVDLLKIVWTPDLADEAQGSRRAQFENALDRAGAGRIILCRCDNVDAIEFGHSLGIVLYQGRYLDKCLAAPSDSSSQMAAPAQPAASSKRRYRQEHPQFAKQRKAMEERVRQREQ